MSEKIMSEKLSIFLLMNKQNMISYRIKENSLTFYMDYTTFKNKGFSIRNHNHPDYIDYIIKDANIKVSDYSMKTFFYYTSFLNDIYEDTLANDINSTKTISYIKYDLNKYYENSGFTDKTKFASITISIN